MVTDKRILLFPGLLLMTALMVFSDAALSAAADGLKLWWTAVLPSLFPFYVGTSLMIAGGAFEHVTRFFSPLFRRSTLPACLPGALLLGAVAGYPTGARLAMECNEPDIVPFVNLCSPIFLVGVVGSGLLGSPRLGIPLLIAHYGASLIALALHSAFRRPHKTCREASKKLDHPIQFSLIQTISEGMMVMLRIGGCIVFFLVLSALCQETGLSKLLSRPLERLGVPAGVADALFTGILEFTGGCRALALADISNRFRLALLAANISFGGLCVYIQACLFLPPSALKGYLPRKLIQAAIAFLIAYSIAPAFLRESLPAMAVNPAEIKQNAIAGGALLCISLAAMAFIYLVAILLGRINRPPVPPKA